MSPGGLSVAPVAKDGLALLYSWHFCDRLPEGMQLEVSVFLVDAGVFGAKVLWRFCKLHFSSHLRFRGV
jgi:hypothetical protein